MTAIVPIPKIDIAIRVATMADVPFMDRLQKMHGKALGYFPMKQFEGYVEMGGVLVAWAPRPCSEEDSSTGEAPVPLGYCISRDRYLKRDELGVIYQLCVSPGVQRKLVGAMLVREVFARSAYGCKLYCCWCAQDLEANYFWESMGFVPVAFRAGSSGKRRVHIFWQRRIDEGDATTPIWYPSQTNSGAIREDRLVFPIPPGTDWKEVEAVVLPSQASPKLEGPKPKPVRSPKRKVQSDKPAPGQVAILVGGRIKHINRPGYAPKEEPDAATPVAAHVPAPVPALAPKEPKPKRPAVKIDPKHAKAARELRDRYLEQYNSGVLLPGGKYDVARAIGTTQRQAMLLPEAA